MLEGYSSAFDVLRHRGVRTPLVSAPGGLQASPASAPSWDKHLLEVMRGGPQTPSSAAAPVAESQFLGLNTGGWLQVSGALMGAIGAFYAADSAKHQLKSQALAAEFEQSMSAINARNAEADAQSVLEAGAQEIAQVTAQYGQEKAALQASTASRGVVSGVGSAAELAASVELAKQVDALTINKNRVRAAGQARMRAADMRSRGLLAGTSANNLRSSAGSINPYLAGSGSLLSAAGNVAATYAYNRRR